MNPNDDPLAPEAPPPARKPARFGGIDPGELLARALNTAEPSAGAQPWTPPTPEELAALLPQYGITALLGCGGMGAVYRGVQSALDRPVAIKLLSAELAADAQFIARFQREARTLAKLQHPGIVAVYDFGQTGAGHPYFVMEFVEGTDLQRILRGPGLNPGQALALISQVCDALHYAHRQGVIHRDIKPANILVTVDGRAKVADFGLARPLAEDTSTLTSGNVILGTDAYMAPEQRTGHADERADIYALGVMLYEMLTGQRPHGVFDPPSRKVQIDIRLDEVVIKALQEEPARRYQQAGEMKTDVDRIRTTPLERRFATAGKDGGAGESAIANRRSVLWSIAACLTLLIAAGFVIWKKANPPGEAEQVGEARQSSSALQRVEPSAATGRPDGLKPSTTLSAATKEQPFVNSLGMKFVPVPETKVLFSIWETRVQDYTAFARAKAVNRIWQSQALDNGIPAPVSREPQHPVCGVTWDDAKRFCRWLTETETTEEKLPKGAAYRLPTDDEWSWAVGLPFEEGATPQEKDGRNDTDFPWGNDFPPKDKVGNFGDTMLRAEFPQQQCIDGYTDGFAGTAPVGSFPGNEYGIFDLEGNVWEWCEDWMNASQERRVGRGGHWLASRRDQLLSSQRGRGLQPSIAFGNGFGGFRCVLDLKGADFIAKNPTSAPVPAVSTNSSEKAVPLPAAAGQSPRPIGTDDDWKAIAAGERHALAIRACHALQRKSELSERVTKANQWRPAREEESLS